MWANTSSPHNGGALLPLDAPAASCPDRKSTLRCTSPDAQTVLNRSQELAQACRPPFLQGKLRRDATGRTHEGPCGSSLVLLAVDEERRIGRILDDAPDLRDLLVAGQGRNGHAEVAQDRELGHRLVVLAGCDRRCREIEDGAEAHRPGLDDA